MIERWSKDLAYQILSTVYGSITSFALFLLLARNLGPEKFGELQYAITVGAFFYFLQDSGLKTLIFRETARSSASLTFDPDHILKLSIFHLILSTLLGCLLFLKNTTILLSILYFSSFTVFTWISYYLKGKGWFAKDAIWTIFFKTSNLAGGILPLAFGIKEPKFILLSMFIFGILPALAVWEPSLEETHLKLSNLPSLYKIAIPFVLIDIFTTAYFKSDVIIIKFVRGFEETGIYAAYHRFLEFAALGLTPFANVFFHRVRRKRDRKESLRIVKLCVLSSLIAGVMIGYTLIAFSRDVVKTLLGSVYTVELKTFKVLILALIFLPANSFLTQASIALEEEKFYAILAFVCAFVSIGFNLYTVPKIGILGASIAALSVEFLLFTFLSCKIFLSKRYEKT